MTVFRVCRRWESSPVSVSVELGLSESGEVVEGLVVLESVGLGVGSVFRVSRAWEGLGEEDVGRYAELLGESLLGSGESIHEVLREFIRSCGFRNDLPCLERYERKLLDLLEPLAGRCGFSVSGVPSVYAVRVE